MRIHLIQKIFCISLYLFILVTYIYAVVFLHVEVIILYGKKKVFSVGGVNMLHKILILALKSKSQSIFFVIQGGVCGVD